MVVKAQFPKRKLMRAKTYLLKLIQQLQTIKDGQDGVDVDTIVGADEGLGQLAQSLSRQDTNTTINNDVLISLKRFSELLVQKDVQDTEEFISYLDKMRVVIELNASDDFDWVFRMSF